MMRKSILLTALSLSLAALCPLAAHGQDGANGGQETKMVMRDMVITIHADGTYSFVPLSESTDATWITVPGIEGSEYGVYRFRKTVPVNAVPSECKVSVTADNRYKLYVNGQLVSLGPTRSDILHWNYATVDIAPYLKAGDNVIAALVWNEGADHAEANQTLRTAFLLKGEDSGLGEALNSNASWLCVRDEGYKSLKQNNIGGYFVTGPGEDIDMHAVISDWMDADASLDGWTAASVMGFPTMQDGGDGGGSSSDWLLQPSRLPEMERTYQRLASVRNVSFTSADGKPVKASVPTDFPASKAAFTVPANTKAVLLLDQGYETNAFTTLNFSGGDNAKITLEYQESLYDQPTEPQDSRQMAASTKGNRDEVEGKVMNGRKDAILSNGKDGQEVTTLSFRTFRYVQMTIETASEPLTVNDFHGTFTSYPFQLESELFSDDEELQKILEIGWRTEKLCAWETYTDCPFYEQLQYFGDSRIQALVTLFSSSDDRLVRNNLEMADISRRVEGITLSRYPSTTPQIIPCYSLVYIMSLHDYMMYRDDAEFIADKLHGTRGIIGYFRKLQGEDGLVRNVPWWNFTDWVPTWNRGIAPVGKDGSSAITNLMYLYALQMAAELEEAYGLHELAEDYGERASQLAAAIQDAYWDASKGLYADDSDHAHYSQHTNSFAILCGLADGDAAMALARKISDDKSLAQATVYFTCYVQEALVKAGFGEEYLSWLDIYRENIAHGLTTWAETSDIEGTRSDCHAWGSSPNYNIYRFLLGIDSAAPGFSEVRIAPNLCGIEEIGGTIPHPQGSVSVSYKVRRGKVSATIDLPAEVGGTFVWNGKEHSLHGGHNELKAE